MPKWLGLAAAFAAAALIGCSEQPYPVFAVQIAAAAQPAALSTGSASPGAAGAAPASASGAAAPSLGAPSGREVKHLRRGPAGPARPWALNLAPATDLAKLPGMDALTLQRILQGRPYASKRDLLRRHVLSPAQYAQWKDKLVVHRGWQAGETRQARSHVLTRP